VSVYVTDTHPLVWYATSKSGKLSKKALSAFSAASRDEALIYVPGFVLWEVAMLLKIGRISLQEDYGDWAEHLIAQPGFDLASFSVEVTTQAYSYPFADPFDGVIAATARVMDLPLITKDRDITDSGLVDIHWS
jgi:PIN domain nuclease of toxin-antitoxin system